MFRIWFTTIRYKKAMRAAARGSSSKEEEYKIRQYSKGGVVKNVLM